MLWEQPVLSDKRFNASKSDILDNLKLDETLKLAKRKLKSGDYEQARSIYKSILTKFPNNKTAKSQFDKLVVQLDPAIKVVKDPPRDQLDDLIAAYRQKDFRGTYLKAKKLLEKFPKSIVLLNLCGASNSKLKQYDTAESYYQQAIVLAPENPGGYQNIGVLFNEKLDYDSAIHNFNKALKLKPDFAEAHKNKAFALMNQNHLWTAMDSLKKAIEINPSFSEAYLLKGTIQNNTFQYTEGLESLQKAIDLNPGLDGPHFVMSKIYHGLNEHEAALICCDKALRSNQKNHGARAQRVLSSLSICNWSNDLWEDVEYLLESMAGGLEPLTMTTVFEDPQILRSATQNYAKTKFTKPSIPLPAIPKTKSTKIHVGYFSADFHEFPGMHLMIGMLENHDRNKFKISAYSYGPPRNDEMRKRIVNAVDHFIDVEKMADEDVALLARQDNVDIAIHRNGHTKNARPEIFSYRAAPIQISYLGYPGTLGADCIDYLIADNVIIPEDLTSAYSEKIIYLPNSYQPNNNKRKISEKQFSKTELGLPQSGFIFCCFNASKKILPAEFDIWMKILKKVSGSVLWLYRSNKQAEANLKNEAIRRGVNSERLIFADRLPHDEHLSRLKVAHLFLDTFNYNAHTTASDALWAGTPVVTKIGKTFSSRVASSLLTAINLPELITKNDEEYENLIIDLANNPQQLSKIKNKLVANRLTTPLFDTELYTKHIENGYQKAYERYFRALKPEHILVSD
ncbi:tetratricopeptide repeat protein [bacterium]|nr:tetratricopeptide repeat protein [bacterium]